MCVEIITVNKIIIVYADFRVLLCIMYFVKHVFNIITYYNIALVTEKWIINSCVFNKTYLNIWYATWNNNYMS